MYPLHILQYYPLALHYRYITHIYYRILRFCRGQAVVEITFVMQIPFGVQGVAQTWLGGLGTGAVKASPLTYSPTGEVISVVSSKGLYLNPFAVVSFNECSPFFSEHSLFFSDNTLFLSDNSLFFSDHFPFSEIISYFSVTFPQYQWRIPVFQWQLPIFQWQFPIFQ